MELHKEKRYQRPKFSSFEDILAHLGGFGTFQVLLVTCLLGPEIPAAFVAFSPVFVGQSSGDWVCETNNSSFNEYYRQLGENICECPGRWKYIGSVQSIVTEWGLICSKTWVSDFITSVQMLGMLLGSLLSSKISDRYGRKWVYFGVCLLMFLGQGLSAFAPDPVFYAGARFLAGAGISGFMGISTVYPLEFLTANRRFLIGSVGPWGEGIMLLALLGYFIQSWRLLLIVSSVTFIPTLIILPFIPESPRWLLRENKTKAALHVCNIIQRINRVKTEPLTEEDMREVSLVENTQRSTGMYTEISYLDFFRDSRLRKRTLVLMGIWFSWSLVYFGISYNIKNIPGDPYLNVMLMGLVDALGYPAALLINNKLGRRKSLVIFMTIGAAFLLSLAVADLTSYQELGSSTIALLCLSGKFGFAGARSAARMLTSESFPTSIRTMGYGISGVTAGVGGLIAPQIAYMGILWWKQLPFVSFAVISVIGSVISFQLQETAGQELQEELRCINEKMINNNKNYQAANLSMTRGP